MKKQTQFSIWYFVFAFASVVVLHDAWQGARTVMPPVARAA